MAVLDVFRATVAPRAGLGAAGARPVPRPRGGRRMFGATLGDLQMDPGRDRRSLRDRGRGAALLCTARLG
jgi:hypothetical protein